VADARLTDEIGRWKEILRRAGIALSGRPVSLWESDAKGRIHLLASSRDIDWHDTVAAELEAELRRWFGDRPAGARWVASRLRARRWCAVPVRSAAWLPPPGDERRSAERMTLELAALCIGLLNGSPAVTAPPAGASHPSDPSQRLVARIVDQVRGALRSPAAEPGITPLGAAGTAGFELLPGEDPTNYPGKAPGRGRFHVFNRGLLRRERTTLVAEANLRSAVEREEFRLLYQPIVELSTGRVHAFEALIRWHHPERGVIPPAAFLPIAEETGFIVPIGQWVLREACAQAGRWQHRSCGGGPVRISVNLSAGQLGDPRIVQDVGQALLEGGVDAQGLRVDIAHAVLMDGDETTVTQLRQLSQMGVALHVDDFGAGHASLSYLPPVPLQSIKIDASFVGRLGMRRTGPELIDSIVELVKRLGMTAIAEGVETAAQCERLVAMGCALGQGYYFAKPLDAEAAGTLLDGPVARA
jgi:EAL domain-containing protein (putative c-di-GMP-specific phosphodiesterase class I)